MVADERIKAKNQKRKAALRIKAKNQICGQTTNFKMDA